MAEHLAEIMHWVIPAIVSGIIIWLTWVTKTLFATTAQLHEVEKEREIWMTECTKHREMSAHLADGAHARQIGIEKLSIEMEYLKTSLADLKDGQISMSGKIEALTVLVAQMSSRYHTPGRENA